MLGMHNMLRDLVAHKGHATAALLAAIRACAPAADDAEILALLHHILLANRFWFLTTIDQPFAFDIESRVSPSFDDLIARHARLQGEEDAWFAAAAPDDLERALTGPQIPNGTCSVAQAYLQVCLHSHGHRAQLARMLRRLGGTPPATDFILWVGPRPEAAWPVDPTV